MPRFSDVEHDGIDLDGALSDRVLFHVIETRSAAFDLPVDEAWSTLAERYPDDARLRLAAIAADVDANGIAGGPEWIVAAFESVLPKLATTDHPAFAGAATLFFEQCGASHDALRARVRRLVSDWPRNEAEAHHALRKFVRRLLDEADERTRGHQPWGDAKVETAADLLAKAEGPARPYAPTQAFARGDRLAHPKFGEGVVLGAAEGKIEVAFADQRRVLVAKV